MTHRYGGWKKLRAVFQGNIEILQRKKKFCLKPPGKPKDSFAHQKLLGFFILLVCTYDTAFFFFFLYIKMVIGCFKWFNLSNLKLVQQPSLALMDTGSYECEIKRECS